MEQEIGDASHRFAEIVRQSIVSFSYRSRKKNPFSPRSSGPRAASRPSRQKQIPSSQPISTISITATAPKDHSRQHAIILANHSASSRLLNVLCSLDYLRPTVDSTHAAILTQQSNGATGSWTAWKSFAICPQTESNE